MSVSISEIIVILLIALLVIKPEQLPEVAFTLGRLAKTIRQMLTKIKDEMNDLIYAHESPPTTDVKALDNSNERKQS